MLTKEPYAKYVQDIYNKNFGDEYSKNTIAYLKQQQMQLRKQMAGNDDTKTEEKTVEKPSGLFVMRKAEEGVSPVNFSQ